MIPCTLRKGSRAPKEVMRSNLSAHYQYVGRQTGQGLFERMKVSSSIMAIDYSLSWTAQDMNFQYMVDHGDELYDAITKDIRDMFENLASDMETEMAETLSKIDKLVLSLLGCTCD
jgi:hypothetical protein